MTFKSLSTLSLIQSLAVIIFSIKIFLSSADSFRFIFSFRSIDKPYRNNYSINSYYCIF